MPTSNDKLCPKKNPGKGDTPGGGPMPGDYLPDLESNTCRTGVVMPSGITWWTGLTRDMDSVHEMNAIVPDASPMYLYFHTPLNHILQWDNGYSAYPEPPWTRLNVGPFIASIIGPWVGAWPALPPIPSSDFHDTGPTQKDVVYDYALPGIGETLYCLRMRDMCLWTNGGAPQGASNMQIYISFAQKV